ncbi:hypothetical protein ccbrp13_42740 [Ktedonobacteria bacterium brp13]|nr:hypothetical protein ccbrp13_42740 [Ktedonobacteria bacterium brp13]
MSNNYTSGPDGPSFPGSGVGSSAISRREVRMSNATGALPSIQTAGAERSTTQGPSDFEQMVLSLHDLFEQDRQIASQQDSTRCGICYLHFHVNELHYRDEGFYVCPNCEHNLGNLHVPMLRRQQKL